ncbi:hypothetical protein [Streptomyces sp. NPDC057052]|uniref:hypothetical protein n=1 Tax=Streptomyces sp. NPDC057052 TaxID=3346010 RepID=UPI003639153A
MSATAPDMPSARISQWEYLPRELGFGSGTTCRRRPTAWNEVGVGGRRPHALLLKQQRPKNQPDRSRAVIDSSHVRTARRGPEPDVAHVSADRFDEVVAVGEDDVGGGAATGGSSNMTGLDIVSPGQPT